MMIDRAPGRSRGMSERVRIVIILSFLENWRREDLVGPVGLLGLIELGAALRSGRWPKSWKSMLEPRQGLSIALCGLGFVICIGMMMGVAFEGEEKSVRRRAVCARHHQNVLCRVFS